MSSTSARVRVARHSAATLLLVGSAVVWAGTSHAAADEACFNFSATAAADALRTEVSSPGFLLVERADAAGPAAQAHTDGLGISRGFAAALYPGDDVLSAGGLAGLPRSTYPLIAESSHPTTPSGEASVGTTTLTSEAAERSAQAKVSGGGPAGSPGSVGFNEAQARTQCSDSGEVSALSSNRDEVVGAAGVLSLGSVTSSAKAVLDATGKTTLSSDFSITGASIAGVPVTIDRKGISVAGNGAALPDSSVLAPLQQAGVTVTYIGETKDTDGRGVVAPGVAITVSRDAVGTGPTVVTYTFGRAYARAAGDATGNSTLADGSGGVVEEPSSTFEEPAVEDAGSTDSPGVDAALATAPMAETASALEAAPEVEQAPVAAAPAAPAAARTGVRLASLPTSGLSWSLLYLVIVVGSAALAGGAGVYRFVGSRWTWI
jgi:hypothetical protein